MGLLDVGRRAVSEPRLNFPLPHVFELNESRHVERCAVRAPTVGTHDDPGSVGEDVRVVGPGADEGDRHAHVQRKRQQRRDDGAGRAPTAGSAASRYRRAAAIAA